VRRWKVRLHLARSTDDAEDYSIAFFQSCHNLRDWVQWDNAMPQVEIEELFKNHAELRLCADISNATKHLRLDDPKQPREFFFAREYCDPGYGWFGDDLSGTFIIFSDGKRYDFRNLADKCVALWLDALRQHHADIA